MDKPDWKIRQKGPVEEPTHRTAELSFLELNILAEFEKMTEAITTAGDLLREIRDYQQATSTQLGELQRTISRQFEIVL